MGGISPDLRNKCCTPHRPGGSRLVAASRGISRHLAASRGISRHLTASHARPVPAKRDCNARERGTQAAPPARMQGAAGRDAAMPEGMPTRSEGLPFVLRVGGGLLPLRLLALLLGCLARRRQPRDQLQAKPLSSRQIIAVYISACCVLGCRGNAPGRPDVGAKSARAAADLAWPLCERVACMQPCAKKTHERHITSVSRSRPSMRMT